MRFARPAVAAILVALVSACTSNPQSQSAPLISREAPRPVPKVVIASQQALVEQPSKLKGLKSSDVRTMLGKPVFTRRDAPAEIWSYRGHACTLDVFLYDEGAAQTVAHYAIRSPSPVSETDCLNELVSQGNNSPAG